MFDFDMALDPSQHGLRLSDAESSQSSSEAGSQCAGIDVSTLFAGVELPQTESPQAAAMPSSSRREASSHQPPDLSHASMLQHAFAVSGIRTTGIRKRVQGKRAFDIRTLQQLATNPCLVTRTTPLSRVAHRVGFHEFRRWYIAVSGVSWREGEVQATKRWAEYTNNQKYHWVLFRQACRECGRAELVQAPPSKLRSVSVPDLPKLQDVEEGGDENAVAGFWLGVGFLLTYFSHIGQDDPDVGVWVRQGFRGAELRAKLLTKMAYRAYFDAFVAFLQKFRDQYGFTSVGACMELGEDADARSVSRVHLHAYVGFLEKDGGIGGMRTVKFPKTAVVFSASTPFVVATRGHKGRRMHEAVGRGMYYVVGPKATSMLRYTDLEPIKESKISKNRIRQVSYIGFSPRFSFA